MDQGVKNTILALKEQGMSAEDIALATGLEAGAVDLVLMAFDKPTKALAKTTGGVFGQEHAELAKTVIMDLMLNGRSPMVKLQAAMFAHDEAMGYRKPKDAVRVAVNVHIDDLNQAIRKARSNERTIDV